MALLTGPLHLSILVFISIMASALYSLLEASTPPHNLTMKSQGYEFILSWEPGNNTGTAAYYLVKYTTVSIDCLMHRTSNAIQSKSPERNLLPRAPSNKPKSYNFKIAKECSNITNLFCNLTKEFTEFCKMYLIIVEQFTESGKQMSALRFNPYLETCLTPASFDLAACPNCINVTVKLSSSLLEIYNQFRYTVKLVKADFTEILIDNYTRKASFHTVVGDLSPNTNYCIAVDVSSSVTNQCTPSPLKCILTSAKDKSGLVAFSVVGGIVIVVALIFSAFSLLKAGFVCLREKLPAVLIIIPKLGIGSIEPLDPKAHSIQITQKGKRKGTEYNYEDDCESDGENDGGYTHRGLLCKISQSGSKAEHTGQLSIDSSVGSDCQLLSDVNSELLDAEVENLQCHTNEEESTSSQTFCSTSDQNFISMPEPEISGCLNVNLNTVMVGISDRNWEADAVLSPYEDNAADLQEPSVSDASELRHFTERKDVHNLPYAQKNSESGESESSDSETDCIGEYMRR